MHYTVGRKTDDFVTLQSFFHCAEGGGNIFIMRDKTLHIELFSIKMTKWNTKSLCQKMKWFASITNYKTLHTELF